MAFIEIDNHIFEITGEKTIIGRAADCDIVINNSYISKKHACIFKQKDHYLIKDLGSKYGTFVNGNEVTSPVNIEDGAIIMLGPVKMVFYESKNTTEEVNIQELYDFLDYVNGIIPDDKNEYTERLKNILSSYKKLVVQNRMYRFFIELANKLKHFNSEALLDFILKQSVKITGAERAIVAKIKKNSFYEVVASYGKMDMERDTLPLSIIKKILKTGEPLIIENAIEDPSWGVHTSILSMNIRSVLAFPVKEGNKIHGVVYMENRSVKGIFTEEHLELARELSAHINAILSLYSTNITRKDIKKKIKELLSTYDFAGMVGESKAFLDILELVVKVAPTCAPVMLLGESGTGKELVAHAIHKNSKRKNGPFIVINCATIPKDLFEAELFGYKKGAFSGAYRDKKGKIEMADGGTLFLDELAELPKETQAKLLRLIQFKEIEPLGATESKTVDIRVISATSKPLKDLIKKGAFREDLYYRLNVFQIDIPPLRERKEDLRILVEHFLKKHGRENRISHEAFSLLANYDFPGNIRELENILIRAVVLAGPGGTIKPEHLPEEISSRNIPHYRDPEYIKKVLEKTNMNVSKAARILGISRRHLYRLMEKYGIK